MLTLAGGRAGCRCYETVFECLRERADRTFNVAEINFFSHWFDVQNVSVQQQVRDMVASGRLGFNEGGWVQPDEGATNYLGRINQATLGQVGGCSAACSAAGSVLAQSWSRGTGWDVGSRRLP